MADQNRLRNNQRFHHLIGSFCEQLNTAFINLHIFISCIFQEEELPAGIFPQAAFAFSIGIILGLLQVKYQGKDKSPFESHPRTTGVATTSLLIYCLAYGIEQRSSSDRTYRIPRCASNTIRCCMLLAGSLSLAATASFLFPDSIRPVLLYSTLLLRQANCYIGFMKDIPENTEEHRDFLCEVQEANCATYRTQMLH